MSSKPSLPVRTYHQNVLHSSHLSQACHMPHHLTFLDFDQLNHSPPNRQQQSSSSGSVAAVVVAVAAAVLVVVVVAAVVVVVVVPEY